MRARNIPALIQAVMIVALLSVVWTPAAYAADKDCGDFNTQKAAQTFYINAGGPEQDPHRLDADDDGIACDSNPCPCSSWQGGGDSGGGGGDDKPKTLRQKAKIISVTDGDTVKVRLIGGPERDVRLIGIDTPEVYGGTECGGPEASKSLKGILPMGTRVTLVSDNTQDYKDRYDRLLRYVIKNDGTDANRRQLYRGWARVYVYDNNPFKRVAGYRDARDNAKKDKRGIWESC